jgi:hypothetical protein
MQAGYPPVVIGPEHRTVYIDVLQTMQLGSDAEPYRRFMAERLEASLDHHISMLERASSSPP